MRERQAFLMLYRVRHANFRYQCAALYRRYAHAIVIFLALFGMLLTERPSLLAEPLLHFWRAPGQWQDSLLHVGGWLIMVTIWASIHRELIRGGALATYSRSLPLTERTSALVDMSMLYVSLQIFLLPYAVALWIATRCGNLRGADGRFCLYLALLAALTVLVARSTVFGPTLRTRCVQAGGVASLVFSQQLPGGMLSLAPLWAALLVCSADAATPPRRRTSSGNGSASGAASLRQPRPALPLLRLACALLFHRHRHAAAMRLLLATLPQLACWWLIIRAGKTADAQVFIQLACAMTTCLTAGFFYTFAIARQTLQPYLRSIAFGAMRMTVAEHLLVVAATGALFGVFLLVLAVALGTQATATVALLRASLYWLAWLPLLGVPLIQRHKDGTLIKFALVIVALLIVFKV